MPPLSPCLATLLKLGDCSTAGGGDDPHPSLAAASNALSRSSVGDWRHCAWGIDLGAMVAVLNSGAIVRDLIVNDCQQEVQEICGSILMIIPDPNATMFAKMYPPTKSIEIQVAMK